MLVKVWVFSLDTLGPSEKTEPRCVLLAKVHLLEYTVYKMDTVTSQSQSSFTFTLAVNLSSKLKLFCMYTQKLPNMEA